MTADRILADASEPGAIDVHHHLLAPDYLRSRRSEVEAISPGYREVLDWTPERSLAQMEAAGVATSILSLSTPGVWFGDAGEARRLARLTNDYGADLVRSHPGRFGLFAAVPALDVDATLAEIDYALDELEADGIGLLSNYEDRYLGDPMFGPMFESLNRRGAIVYVHPTTHACCLNLVSELSPAFLEFPFDTTRTIASLLYAGVLQRTPRVRWIFSHGGGALPMLADRLSNWARARPDLGVASPADAMQLLRRLNFDTASVTNPAGFDALKAHAGVSRILFGTDYPYVQVAPQMQQLQGLGLAAGELTAIRYGNARRLLGSARPR